MCYSWSPLLSWSSVFHTVEETSSTIPIVTTWLWPNSCGNIKINAIYGLIAAVFIGGFDMFCISMSFAMIIHAVVKLSSADVRHKAFSTCTSHICAIVITYVSAFFNFFTHHFGGSTIPHHVHIFIANLYLLLPPTLNPIVYGVKTKQIREGVIKLC